MKGVYIIINGFDGKYYVGSAADMEKRFASHRGCLRKGKHINRHLQYAWKRDGEGSFVFVPLEMVDGDKSALLMVEQTWLDLLSVVNPSFGYNHLPTAGSNAGYVPAPRTPEARARMSASAIARGNHLTPEGAENSRQATIRRSLIKPGCKGYSHTAEAKASMAAKRIGNSYAVGSKHTDEWRKAQSELKRGRARSDIRHFGNTEIEYMRALKATGASYSQLVSKFGLSIGSAFDICHGRTYAVA